MELKEAITTRRSVRKYKDEPIAEETIRELLELASWAPSGTNTQPWLYTVIEGKDYLKGLSDRCKPYILEAMDALPALEIYRTTLSNPGYNIFHGASTLVLIYGNQNAFTYPNDCSMAALNLMLAAWDRGIGSCWVGFARALCGTPEFKAELDVPPQYQLVAPVILGYPVGKPGHGARKEVKVCFHRK